MKDFDEYCFEIENILNSPDNPEASGEILCCGASQKQRL